MAEGGRWQEQPLRMGMKDIVVRLYNTTCPQILSVCMSIQHFLTNHVHQPFLYICRQIGPLCTCTRARFFTRSTSFPDLPVPFACDCREQKSEASFF